MKFLIIALIFAAEIIVAQKSTDSTQTMSDHAETVKFKKLNSLKTDWVIINSPFMFYPTNNLYTPNSSLHSLYTDFQLNNSSGFSVNPNVMLNQFQLINNWEAKKKYGVFARYLGIAEFIGAVGLAAVHISKYHKPPKGKTNFDPNKLFPKKGSK